MATYWYVFLQQLWIGVGILVVFAPRFRNLIHQERQITNPDHSFYRRNDNDFLRLIFYFILWCLIPALLFCLWLYVTGQLYLSRHGA